MNSKKDKYLSFFLIKREGNEIKEYNPDGTKNPWVSEEGSQAKWKKFNSSDCDNRISSARGDLAKSNIVVVFEYLLYFKSHAKRWKVYIFALLFFDTWIRKVARLCDVLQANWRVRIGLHVFFSQSENGLFLELCIKGNETGTLKRIIYLRFKPILPQGTGFWTLLNSIWCNIFSSLAHENRILC